MKGKVVRQIRNEIYGEDANGRDRKYKWKVRTAKRGRRHKLDAGELRQNYQQAKREYTAK